MMLVNGKLCTHLPILDRGLQYGDGVWETLVYHSHHIQQWDAHIQRLMRGLKALSLSLGQQNGQPVTIAMIYDEIIEQLKYERSGALKQRCIIKLIITRGSGGRGYSAKGLYDSTRIISFHPFPQWPSEWYQKGINVTLCKTQLAHQPLLAGFKHLNRLEQVLARSEFDDAFQEGLVCDYNGNVIEGTMSNLFLLDQNNHFFTPSLLKCGIEGVARACILKIFQSPDHSMKRYQCEIKTITLDEVRAAKALFVCNSVLGLWPVRYFENKEYKVPEAVYQLQSVLHTLL